ncbi:centromere protein P isoform X1 [Cebus imitator]|uniref:centromere protein P isoform X1 n=1 Tax=Cebus imitator TaxID=2715852 RepID=UPI00189C0669|nr:centromere protein P isoform X1 [Cebus imitator]
MVTFQLEFQILEIQNKERLSSAVTDLNIIMEPTECSELSEFVSRAEERKDLFMFFRSLHFFVEWFEYRKRTFKHFKEKYPDAVHLSEGPSSPSIVIRSASQPGFELVIVWRIQIDEDGKVFPKLDLLTKVPQRGRVPGCSCFRCLLNVPSKAAYFLWVSQGKNQKLEISLMYFVYQVLNILTINNH